MAKTAAKTASAVSEIVSETVKKTRDTKPVDVTIDTDIAVPASRKGMRPYTGRFPFDKLAVGQSFALPVNDGEDSNKIATMLSASARAYSRARAENKFAFTVATRHLDGGKKEVRIWRKEDSLPRPRKTKEA